MVTQHSAITDPNIHEPKGVLYASSGQVYFADGAGSGNWEAPVTTIEKRAFSGATSEEFTGLSDYSTIVFTIHGLQSTAAEDLLIQFSTASTYRTTGYLDGVVTDDLSSVTDSDGTAIRIGNFEQVYGYGVVTITNLNSATLPTTVDSWFCSADVNHASSTSADTASRLANYFGTYPTAEAHEKLKIFTTNSEALTDGGSGFINIYGY